MTPEQASIVRSTWLVVLPVGDTFAELFYGKLFSVDPALRRLFSEDMVEQGRSLTAMLSVAAANMARRAALRAGARPDRRVRRRG